MKRIFTIAAVVIAVAAMGLVLVSNKKTLDSKNVVIDRSSVPVAVNLQTAKVLPLEDQLMAPATLAANEEADISAASSGRIANLRIELGSHVTKGQVIGRLDVKENELKLQSTQLAIEKLQRDYERNKILVAGNATNKNAVADSKYDLDSKILEAAQLEKQISNSSIVAPISGIVTEKKMQTGEYANTGSAIATVVDVHTLKAVVYVAENQVFKLATGQKANITTDAYPGETFKGKVTYISPQGDENHNYLVELTIENDKTSQLKAGLYALVNFSNTEVQKALQIPKVALVDGVKNPFVYVAANKKVMERKIVLGREVGENIEVKSGLAEGDQVVISGQINLVNGSSIREVTTLTK